MDTVDFRTRLIIGRDHDYSICPKPSNLPTKKQKPKTKFKIEDECSINLTNDKPYEDVLQIKQEPVEIKDEHRDTENAHSAHKSTSPSQMLQKSEMVPHTNLAKGPNSSIPVPKSILRKEGAKLLAKILDSYGAAMPPTPPRFSKGDDKSEDSSPQQPTVNKLNSNRLYKPNKALSLTKLEEKSQESQEIIKEHNETESVRNTCPSSSPSQVHQKSKIHLDSSLANGQNSIITGLESKEDYSTPSRLRIKQESLESIDEYRETGRLHSTYQFLSPSQVLQKNEMVLDGDLTNSQKSSTIVPKRILRRKRTKILNSDALVMPQRPAVSELNGNRPSKQNRVLKLTELEEEILNKEGYPIPLHLPLSRADSLFLRYVRRKIQKRIYGRIAHQRKLEFVSQLECQVKNLTKNNGHFRSITASLLISNGKLNAKVQELQAAMARMQQQLLQK